MPTETPIAYLLSQYPAFSHAFLSYEIAELRRLGFTIRTASVERPAKSHPLSERMRADANTTFYIKSVPKLRRMGFALKTLFSRPLLFLRGMRTALKVEPRTVKALFQLTEALQLGEWMQQQRLGHLHIHSGGPVASIGHIAAAACRFPYSLAIHGPDEFSNEQLFHLREKVTGATFVICISDFSRGQVMRLLPPEQWEKLHVARLGVDPEMFVPRRARSFASPVELVCVGQLIPSKGHLLLLQAMSDLIQKGHHLRLTLVGDGPLRGQLQTSVQSHGLTESVHFTGPCAHEETQGYLAQADIFILPSLADSLPVALMEAMASQLPCISTCVDGIPELITNEVDGLLVAASSISGLTEAMELLISDSRMRGQMGEAARQRVLEGYRLEDNVRKLATLFDELIPRAQRRG